MSSFNGDKSMESQITKEDLEKIEAGIREKYIKVAKSPEGQFKYLTGKKGLEALHYDKTLIDKLPDAVASSYCGGGDPTETQIRLYERWAEGGVALSFIGEVQGDPRFPEKPGNLVLGAHSNQNLLQFGR